VKALILCLGFELGTFMFIEEAASGVALVECLWLSLGMAGVALIAFWPVERTEPGWRLIATSAHILGRFFLVATVLIAMVFRPLW
jgi:hypothetical protein